MGTWDNKVVVVTGGSDGLGLAICQAYAQAGAICIAMARDESKLQTACDQVRSEGSQLEWVVGDVTDDQSVAAAVAEVVARHGRIDVWVNNVGKSTRIKFEQCGIDVYQQLMELNLYSAIRCTLAVLDTLVQSSGQIVNIGSLAAKTGWPNVAPYSVSKHSLAAFSHQLRIEGPENVSCLFVCPGPIRRSDANVRYEAEAANLSGAAAQPGAGVKLKGIEPSVLADKIVRYSERRKPELVMPGYSRILFAIAQISPRIGDFLLRRSTRNK